MVADLAVRPAVVDDWPAVCDLRNFYVRTSAAIYTDLETPFEDFAALLRRRDFARHPMTVAEVGGRFAGYAVLAPFDDKPGYAATAEDSLYVAPEFHGCGVGRALLGDLLDRGRAAGLHCVVARVNSGQAASLRLHESAGFVRAGVLREAGFKFGAWRDVVYLQRLL